VSGVPWLVDGFLPDPTQVALLATLFIGYLPNLVLAQGLTGWTLGRLVTGTRLIKMTSNDPPGLLRASIRLVLWVPFAWTSPVLAGLAVLVNLISVAMFLAGAETLPDTLVRTRIMRPKEMPRQPPYLS
jgi:RDD family